ncbi:MAG: sugar O-acetyltransferase, partial [Muribaculaceae bacterium]|nr:sugar O-acetyltransferase [Muribaculaceae bacterium]
MMTEKEKMLAGMIYDANNDPALIEERRRCKEMCRDYNTLRPSDTAGRDALLRAMLGSVGASLLIEQPFYCDYGYNIRAGENFYANFNLVILDEAPVTFGDNVFIAPNCGFYTAGHPLDPVERNKGLEYARPIT